MLHQALAEFDKQWPNHFEDLKGLVRIPSVSFPGFDPKEVRKSADFVAGLLKKAGLDRVEILTLPGAHPYVYGEKIIDPKLPTLLLYAHHDVQPLGRESVWKTKPFEPTEVDSPQGKRLFARGAADDKAGVIVHASAIASYLKTSGKLPVNVKVVIEGEEEIGSEHLFEFLTKYRSMLSADVLVLTDTSNFEPGIPALTVALRGLVTVEVEVRALHKTVHSGMWGGPLPDPVMGLSRALASLVDENGKIAVPELKALAPKLDPRDEAELEKLPFDEARFRDQSGLIEKAQILREGPSVWGQLWRYPSLIINAIQASERGKAGNIINDVAWARVGLRLPPGMDPEKSQAALIQAIKRNIPWGMEVTIKSDTAAGGWATDPYGKGRPAFEAASYALKKGYGCEVVKMGCGGTIPFVQPFADALGGVPALLIGVEDPYTNAHGENESVLIEDLRRACVSQIYLFDELAKKIK